MTSQPPAENARSAQGQHVSYNCGSGRAGRAPGGGDPHIEARAVKRTQMPLSTAAKHQNTYISVKLLYDC